MSAPNPVDISSRLGFVNGLGLPEAPSGILSLRLRGPEPAPSEPAAFIDAGSVMSFVANVSEQTRNDILNSTMLAQLAADKKFDREAQTADWYKQYKQVLEGVGWVVQDFAFSKYTADGNKLDVDKAILTILGALAMGAGELAVIQAAIDSAKAIADGDGRITIFDHFSAKKQVGSFQIGVAAESNGAVSLKLGAFRLESSSSVTKILWFKFARQSTAIYQGTQTATLNAGIYSPLRTTIEKKLGDRAKAFVAGLEI